VGRSTANDDLLVLSGNQLQYVYETILSLDEGDGYMENGVLYNEAKLYKEYKSSSGVIKGLARSIGCGNGSSGIVIYSNGDCAPCEMLSEAVCGNIFESNFGDIWKNSNVLSDFRELFNKSVSDIDGCEDCKINDRCGGSCRAEPYISGNILGKGSMCIKDLFVNT